jgi:SOS response regulatory protein OraA/RecX
VDADWTEQAAKSAKEYINYSSFSRQGLINQLLYEEFSQADAVHGADASGADWMEQAAKSAKQYLDYSSFSRQGLIDQLIYEGFSNAQAEYGVSQNGY